MPKIILNGTNIFFTIYVLSEYSSPLRCVFESRQELWILSFVEAIQLLMERLWFYSSA